VDFEIQSLNVSEFDVGDLTTYPGQGGFHPDNWCGVLGCRVQHCTDNWCATQACTDQTCTGLDCFDDMCGTDCGSLCPNNCTGDGCGHPPQ
jgi:hypothetical protein